MLKVKNLAHEKSSAMYLSIIITWILCLIWFGPKLSYIFQNLDTVLEKTLMIIFTTCLNVFWFYGFYHIYILVFGYISGGLNILDSNSKNTYPKIAILHTTCNDFSYKRALTCIKQDYPNYHVFLLDDSTEEKIIRKVDSFHREFPDSTTVVRRKNRDGFKAGAINNALANYAQGYEYFAVSDSDGSLPPDFLTKMVKYFDGRIGFVQSNHRYNPDQKGKFIEDLGVTIDVLWRHHLSVRNKYGFVMCLGHGVLIRRDVWEEVGGFPQIVSEDLAITIRMLEHGYRGYFAKEVVCGADFPEDFVTFRKRCVRWIKADCECLLREFFSFRFLRAKGVSWVEKLDALVREGRLPMTPLFLLFCLITSLFPLLSGETRLLTILGHSWHVPILGSEFNSILSWDFAGLTLLIAFSPWYCFMIDLKHPLRVFRLICHSMMAYCSLILLSAINVFIFMLTRRAYFAVTGESERKRSVKDLSGPLEIMVGIFFSYISLITLNFTLMGIASTLVLAPFINKFGWENRPLSILIYLPPLLVFFGLVVSTFTASLTLSGLPIILF